MASELPLISEDGATFTFKLKKGIKFSDGSKLTSKDVKETFSVMADPNYTGLYSSNVDSFYHYFPFKYLCTTHYASFSCCFNQFIIIFTCC